MVEQRRHVQGPEQTANSTLTLLPTNDATHCTLRGDRRLARAYQDFLSRQTQLLLARMVESTFSCKTASFGGWRNS